MEEKKMSVLRCSRCDCRDSRIPVSKYKLIGAFSVYACGHCAARYNIAVYETFGKRMAALEARSEVLEALPEFDMSGQSSDSKPISGSLEAMDLPLQQADVVTSMSARYECLLQHRLEQAALNAEIMKYSQEWFPREAEVHSSWANFSTEQDDVNDDVNAKASAETLDSILLSDV